MSLIGHCSLKKHKEYMLNWSFFIFFVTDDASINLHLSFKMSLNLKHFAVLNFFTVGCLSSVVFATMWNVDTYRYCVFNSNNQS